MFTIDLDMANATARENRLKRALVPVMDTYDVIVCDCPPNLTIPTQNALAASTHFAVPISPDFLSAIGVGLLLDRVKVFSADLEHEITLAGIIVSRIGRRAQHRDDTVATMRKRFAADVLTAQISERVAVSEAAEKHICIYNHDNRDASAEFSAVAEELLARISGEEK